MCWSLFSIKLPALIKKINQHRCFPLTFPKYLRTTFFTEHLQWLLLKIHKKSNLWQFFLQNWRLQDFNLNENALPQRHLDKEFKEKILPKSTFKVFEKETSPMTLKSSTNYISLNRTHLLYSCLNHYWTTICFSLKFSLLLLTIKWLTCYFDVFESWI